MKHYLHLLFFFFILLFPLIGQASMRTYNCEDIWPYVIRCDSEQEECNRLIIYLHGDGISQVNSTTIELPVYNNRIKASKDTWVLCPLGKEDGDFARNTDNLKAFIGRMKKEYNAAHTYLVGYSNGALAAYRIAASNGNFCDGYVLLSLPTGQLGTAFAPANSLFVTGDSDKNKDAIFDIFARFLGKSAKEMAKIEATGSRALVCGYYSHGNVISFLSTQKFTRWMDAMENGGDLYEALK